MPSVKSVKFAKPPTAALHAKTAAKNFHPDAASAMQLLHARLATLSPQRITVSDQSAAHRGHPEAHAGGHFHVEIVSHRFHNMSSLLRHRLVYTALGDLLALGVHALSLKTKTPSENTAEAASG